MSEGAVCICSHYKALHYDNHGRLSHCYWEWHGKTCDCREYRDDERGTQLIREFMELFHPEVQKGEAHGNH